MFLVGLESTRIITRKTLVNRPQAPIHLALIELRIFLILLRDSPAVPIFLQKNGAKKVSPLNLYGIFLCFFDQELSLSFIRALRLTRFVFSSLSSASFLNNSLPNFFLALANDRLLISGIT